MTVLAFDLGGSRLKAGLVSPEDGRCSNQIAVPAPSAGEVPDLLAEVGEKLLGGEDADGVGLCVPGLIEDGRIVALPGKLDGIVGMDLAGSLRARFDAEPVITNDALAAGIGEARFGAGRGASRVVVVTIGTGIGVAIVEAGVALGAGRHGGGILGGQIPIGGDGTDTSGRSGTIEALCRAQRIVELAAEHGAGYETVEDVYGGHEAGDTAAARAIARYRADLARAVTALAHAHAPDRIVIGGGPVTRSNPITPGLTELIRPALFEGYAVEVVPAALGDSAALAGLAGLWSARA